MDKVRLQVSLTRPELKALKIRAIEADMSVSDYVREVLGLSTVVTQEVNTEVTQVSTDSIQEPKLPF